MNATPRQLHLFGEIHGRVDPLRPTYAPTSTKPSPLATARAETWAAASTARARAVEALTAVGVAAGARAKRGRPAVDLDRLLASLDKAADAERAAWAMSAPDIASGGFPTRLRNARLQRPVDLHYDHSTGEVRSAARRGARDILVATVQRQPGGGYECQARVRLIGDNLSAVMERARLLTELGG